MDAKSVPKNLENFEFDNPNAILMKYATIMYLHKIFNLARNLVLTHRTKEGINKKPLRKSQKISFLA